MATYMSDALFSVFDEKTKKTTFLVLTVSAASWREFATKVARQERSYNNLDDGRVYTYVTNDACGSMDHWLEVELG